MNISNLDLNLLNIFDVIYTTRSITHAADRLNMNQPTLSNALARLRKQMDDPLFVRDGRTMAPTAKARKIIAPVRRALSEIESINTQEEVFDPLKHKRDFSIHMIGTLEIAIMPYLISKAGSARGVTYEYLSPTLTPAETAVSSGQADIAITLAPIANPELKWEKLCNLELVALVRKDHPTIKEELTEELFYASDHIVYNQAPSSGTSGTKSISNKLIVNDTYSKVHPLVRADRDLTMAIYASMSDLIAVVPRVFANSVPESWGLRIMECPLPPHPQPICMVWRDEIAADPGIEWLKEQLRIVTKELIAKSNKNKKAPS